MIENGHKKVVIIGAGPSGLTAAYELCKIGVKSVVLEKDEIVGGISRTVNYRGYRLRIEIRKSRHRAARPSPHICQTSAQRRLAD